MNGLFYIRSAGLDNTAVRPYILRHYSRLKNQGSHHGKTPTP